MKANPPFRLLFLIGHIGNLCLIMGLLNSCGSVSQAPPLVQSRPAAPIPSATTQQPVNSGQLVWSGELNIVDAGRYRGILFRHNICNQYNILNLGTANCKAWDEDAQITLSFQKKQPPSTATLTIQPVVRHWSIGGGIQGQRSFVQLVLQGTAQAINDFEGFQIKLKRSGFGISSPITAKSRSQSPYTDSRNIDLELFDGSSARSNMRFATADLENTSLNDGYENAKRAR